MNTPSERRSGERVGCSPLSSGPTPTFDAPAAGLPRAADGRFSTGKPVAYMHQRHHQRSDGRSQWGVEDIHGAAPVSIAPSIGENEPGFGGPGSEPSALQHFADSVLGHFNKLLGR
jgi:hypothetical protein